MPGRRQFSTSRSKLGMRGHQAAWESFFFFFFGGADLPTLYSLYATRRLIEHQVYLSAGLEGGMFSV